jgi:hypothetical protein
VCPRNRPVGDWGKMAVSRASAADAQPDYPRR